MAQCATTALAGAVPRPCVRGARGRFGGLGPVHGVVSLPFPSSRPACPALRVAGRLVRVSLILARWYAIPGGLCVPQAQPVAFLVVPACPLRVCALALPRRPLPPPWVVWRAHLTRSRHWALVGPFHVVCAPPRVLPRSLAPCGVLGGGRSGPGSPLPGLGLLLRLASEVRRSPSPDCPPTGRAVGVRSPRAVGTGVWVWGPNTVPLACMPCGGCVPRGRCGGGPSPGRGGLPLLGGASGVRRCPSPIRPSSGAGSRGTAARVFRVRSVQVWGPSTGPTACALAGWRCVPWGWRKGVPGGGAVRRCEGRLGSGTPPPPAAHPLGGLPGPTTHWLWVRGGAGLGTRHQPHTARSCELALRTVGAARGRPGGAPAAWPWGVRGRALSRPRLPALWAGCRGPLPTGCWCGGGRAWGPLTNPTARALASWFCALWGPQEGAPGGAPPAWVWGVRGRALSHPRLPTLWAGCRGPLPTGCGCGGVQAWGPVNNPTWRALACCGGGMRVPGGAPLAWVLGVRGRALSHPRLPALWAGCQGPLPTGCGCGGVQAWGPVTNPTARALASWLCALWRRHEGARGGRLLPGCGVSGVRRSPSPDCPPSGRAAGAHYPLAVGAGGCGRGGPSPTPQRALLRAGFARWGGGTRSPGEGASCLGVGRPGSGALPPPTARPLGGLPGPTTHWLWVRGGAGMGTCHQPHSARSCELALRAVAAA